MLVFNKTSIYFEQYQNIIIGYRKTKEYDKHPILTGYEMTHGRDEIDHETPVINKIKILMKNFKNLVDFNKSDYKIVSAFLKVVDNLKCDLTIEKHQIEDKKLSELIKVHLMDPNLLIGTEK